jgi:hypothetical protein
VLSEDRSWHPLTLLTAPAVSVPSLAINLRVVLPVIAPDIMLTQSLRVPRPRLSLLQFLVATLPVLILLVYFLIAAHRRLALPIQLSIRRAALTVIIMSDLVPSLIFGCSTTSWYRHIQRMFWFRIVELNIWDMISKNLLVIIIQLPDPIPFPARN